MKFEQDSEVLHSNTCPQPVSKQTSLLKAMKWNNFWHDGSRICSRVCLPFRSTWFHLWFSYRFMLSCYLWLLISCNCVVFWILLDCIISLYFVVIWDRVLEHTHKKRKDVN